MKEVWRKIPGWPNYMASNLGRVKSLDRTFETIRNGSRFVLKIKGKILKAVKNSRGYKRVQLHEKGVAKTFLIRRLVICSFRNLPLDYPHDVENIDKNKKNDQLKNLRFKNRNSALKQKGGKRLKKRYKVA